MKCSWCGNAISIFRYLANSEYCCAKHRQEEREHTKRLAIERLLGAVPQPKQVYITRTRVKSEARSPVDISFGQPTFK